MVLNQVIVKISGEDLKQNLVKTKSSNSSNFQDDLKKLQGNKKALEEENDELKRQILVFSSSNAKLTKRITDLEAYTAVLEDEREKRNSHLQDELKRVQEQRTTLDSENVDLKKKLSDCERDLSSSKKVLKEKEEKKVEIEDSEKMNELTRRLQEVKDLLILEREDHKKEKEGLAQRIYNLEKALKIKNRDCEDKKDMELKCMRLSKQNSDFQKVIFLEKQKLEKEKVEFEDQRKDFEVKNGNLSKKISELQEELDLERGELEKKKKADFQARSVKDDFSVERKIFQQEIKKLTMNLAVLSTNIIIEQLNKSDIQKKLDLMTKERNDLSDKVRSFNKSKSFSRSPIRSSNLFYDQSVDRSSKSYADLPSYKRINMQWRAIGKLPIKDVPKSSFPDKNSKTKVNSFCGNLDFVNNDSVQYWYGTYHFPSYKAPLNKPGPKTRWVPKST